MNNVVFAFLLTLFAGLSTGIGSLIGLYSKKTDYNFLSGSLGFSAGVMIYVSMIEIFPKSKQSLMLVYGDSKGYTITTIAFFLGIALIAIIDNLIPQNENPHEIQNLKHVDDKNHENENSKNLMRVGMFSAVAIGIHNFPEGLATFVGALQEPNLGISIAVAVAIHNIPEGIAVSVPIYLATKDKKKAFKISFLSGLSEPLGAIVGYLFLRNFFTDATFGVVFALVAGIMVYISIDELLPTAEKYGRHHITIAGVVAGMGLMAVSLLMFS